MEGDPDCLGCVPERENGQLNSFVAKELLDFADDLLLTWMADSEVVISWKIEVDFLLLRFNRQFRPQSSTSHQEGGRKAVFRR